MAEEYPAEFVFVELIHDEEFNQKLLTKKSPLPFERWIKIFAERSRGPGKRQLRMVQREVIDRVIADFLFVERDQTGEVILAEDGYAAKGKGYFGRKQGVPNRLRWHRELMQASPDQRSVEGFFLNGCIEPLKRALTEMLEWSLYGDGPTSNGGNYPNEEYEQKLLPAIQESSGTPTPYLGELPKEICIACKAELDSYYNNKETKLRSGSHAKYRTQIAEDLEGKVPPGEEWETACEISVVAIDEYLYRRRVTQEISNKEKYRTAMKLSDVDRWLKRLAEVNLTERDHKIVKQLCYDRVLAPVKTLAISCSHDGARQEETDSRTDAWLDIFDRTDLTSLERASLCDVVEGILPGSGVTEADLNELEQLPMSRRNEILNAAMTRIRDSKFDS
ncbi:hypothetical protein [Stieleria varia]|uniref:hypothetical protein n=1 Tax=Stieleria varia TaxID=2528005 RepID=UPI0011B4CE2D|nr:hypothetical protein [Stieleria varia]